MIKSKSKRTRAATILGLTVLFIGILFFLLRGPYLSNSIKRIFIPVLENATRERIIIDKAVINLFPFYLQTKGFKLFDKDGNRLLWITKARVYIDLLGLLSKEIRVRKLTLKEPTLTASEEDLRRMIKNIRKSLSVGERGKYAVSLKNIKFTNGDIKYSDSSGLTGISGKGLFLDMVLKDNTSKMDILLENLAVKLPNNAELSGGFNGKIEVDNQRIKVSELNVRSSKSNLSVKGETIISSEGKVENGNFSGKAEIYAATINRIFGLENENEGVLSFSGSIDLTSDRNSKWPEFTFDLQTDSAFHLETLMEILKVEENIAGKLAVKGRISGTFPDLYGDGIVKLEDAVFDTLPLDNLSGDIIYENQKFSLNSFTAHAYGGKLRGDAYILTTNGDYSVIADTYDISSPEFFRFIKWEAPFPKGKIDGNFTLDHKQGQDIAVKAEVNYLNTSRIEGDLLNRIKSIQTVLELTNDILRLNGAVLSTSHSNLFLDGNINLKKASLDLDVRLDSGNAADLTAPYYTKFLAPAVFKGKAKGLLEGPEISGKLEVDSGSIHGVRFVSAVADLKYNIKSLYIDRLRIDQQKANCNISGKIDFRGAKGLFSFNSPFYKAKAVVNNINLEPFIAAVYKDVPVSGHVGGAVAFEGDAKNFEAGGDLVVKDSSIYGQKLDRIAVTTTLYPDKIEIQSVTAYKGESVMAAKGTFAFNRKFNVSVSSNNFSLRDIDMISDYPVNAIFNLDANGSGTIDNPNIGFSVNVVESSIKDIQTGKGEIWGNLQDREMFAKGDFVNGAVTADAGVAFTGKIPWTLDVNFKKGRYDFLLSGFLSEVPDDLTASLEGRIKLKGRGNKISMQTKIDSVNIGMYGYDFRNNEDIVLELDDGELIIKSISLAGYNAELFASGVIKINENYNLKIKGDLDIAPLRMLSSKFTSLKGRSSFALDITGSWEKPQVSGDITIKDAIAAFTEFPYKVGPVNGTFFLKKDRIIFDSLSAGFAGGAVNMSGVGFFDKLSLNRVYISSDIHDIKMKFEEGVGATIGGKLFYESSLKGASLTGNIDVKKAKYKKRVEWKSWLIGYKEIKESALNYPEFLKDTELNIRIAGSDDIIIDNNIARSPVKMSLNVAGTVSQYGLIGRIEASEGTIYFRNNEFNIIEGSSVDFVSPYEIAPVFNILAETYLSNYYIRLSLGGTMDKFSLSLFSDPPLSETEILSLLTFGQIAKEAKGIESGIAAGEATALITGGIQEEVEKEFQYITGFDRFEIEPYTTSEGAFTPRITVGKRLLEDKIFVTYSDAIGTAEEQIIKVKYKLTDKLSLVGSKDEIGSTGVDIKYKFEFK